jgi:hypothetical protein
VEAIIDSSKKQEDNRGGKMLSWEVKTKEGKEAAARSLGCFLKVTENKY